MKERNGAKILVESLENENVEYIFGIPGEQTIPIMEELRKSEIEFITTRHEQGAAFMADIYSRVSGNVGVCLATLGPGASNLVTGVGNASLDHSAVVALTSQRETEDQHKHSHQFINTNSMFDSVTKLTDHVRSADTIPEQVRKAFEVADRDKKGATHLELPLDKTLEMSDVEPIDCSGSKVQPSGVQASNIEKALSIVEKSERPVIMAGYGVISGNASQELRNFVDKTNIPVVTTFMGKGSISARSNMSVGTVGFGSNDYAMNAVKKSDLVLTVGYDYIEYHPESWNIGADKDIVHIDTTPPEIDGHYNVEMDIVGDISRVLDQMTQHSQSYVDDSYSSELKNHFQEKMNEEYRENDSSPFTPQQIISEIREVLSDEDILICDVGSHKYWFSRRYPTYEPESFIVSNGFASMAVSAPGSIAASLCSDNEVVSVSGDGGLLMNIQELETASRLDLDQTLIVLNDNEYTAISMEQEKDYDEKYGISFDNPDFVSLAESFGCDGYRVDDSDEIQETLKVAIESDNVSLIDIPIDPEEAYKLEENIK